VIRAVLKPPIVRRRPELAGAVVEGGLPRTLRLCAWQTLTENPYGAWREYDAETRCALCAAVHGWA